MTNTRSIEPWQQELLDELEEIDFSQIAKLQAIAHKNSRLHGFWDDIEEILALPGIPEKYLAKIRGMEVSQKIALVHDEVSERHDEARSGHAGNHTYFTTKDLFGNQVVVQPEDYDSFEERDLKPEGQGAEAADGFIRELDLAEWDEIDLASSIKLKMRHNIFRAPKHGRAY